MTLSPHRQDRLLSVIFEQMELLAELATRAGDMTLAADLSAALAAALFRRADARAQPADTLAGG